MPSSPSSSSTSSSSDDWTLTEEDNIIMNDDDDALINKAFQNELKELANLRVIVVGGCGFLGRNIVNILLQLRTCHVRVFDLRVTEYSDEVEFITGDLLNTKQVDDAMVNQDVCIHVASPPPTLPNKKLLYDVNVTGTANVISACRKANVKKLVYTSSASVVFDGTNQRNLDETTLPPERALDGYTISKLHAEQLVLGAVTTDDDNALAVCALRPHGIFGPHDPHLMPALSRAGRGKKSHYMIGDGNNLVDFTYVGNVAFAHCLAAAKLQQNSIINGRAYFITNQQPVLFWDFISRLQEGMGYALPYLVMPVPMMLVVARIAAFFAKIFKFTPTFTKQSITYAAVDHYYCSERAYRDFGYVPVYTLEEGIRRTLAHFETLANEKYLQESHINDRESHLAESAHPTLHIPTQRQVPRVYLSSLIMPLIAFLLIIHTAFSFTSYVSEYYSYMVIKICLCILLPYLVTQSVRECKYFKSVTFDEDVDLSNKIVAITGGNRGIGYGVAKQFASAGAKVIIICRSNEYAGKACEEITRTTGNRNVSYEVCDLGSVASVNDFIQEFKRRGVILDILVNNAASMPNKTTSIDGFDLQVQINYLGPFLLTNMLLDDGLIATDGRVVNVSSWMHVNGRVNWDDFHYTKSYRNFPVYWDTKLMNVLFSNELNQHFRRIRSYRTSVSLHPGNVQTDFILHFIPKWLKVLVDPLLSLFLLQSDECAEKILMASVGKTTIGVGGVYLSHGKVTRPAPLARDRLSMERLWMMTQRILEYKVKWCVKHE